MVNMAGLSWEAFLLALNFAHITACSPTITMSTFEALYGYKPKIPLYSLDTLNAPNTFATERMLILKKALE